MGMKRLFEGAAEVNWYLQMAAPGYCTPAVYYSSSPIESDAAKVTLNALEMDGKQVGPW